MVHNLAKKPPAKSSRQFYFLVKKEFYHIFRDPRTLIILLGMPIVQIIIFGFALTNEVKNSRMGILDQARDITAQTLITQMEASQYFEEAEYFTSYSQIEAAFEKGNIKLALVLPANFGMDLQHLHKAQIQLITDASDPNLANILSFYATAIIQDFQDRITPNAGLPYTIHTATRMLYNPQLQGAFSFVPGVMAMVLMLVCTMMTAITIVREKELGTMEVLLVSPVQPFKIILAKAVPYLLLSILNIASILLLSRFVLQVPVNGSLELLLAAAILFTITSLSLGLLISTITNSQQTAMFISLTGLFLPTVMLSGFMFPIENMPLPLQLISNLVPAKWFYIIIRSVMIKGAGFLLIWKEVLVLTFMTILFLSLSIKNFKIRLK